MEVRSLEMVVKDSQFKKWDHYIRQNKGKILINSGLDNQVTVNEKRFFVLYHGEIIALIRLRIHGHFVDVFTMVLKRNLRFILYFSKIFKCLSLELFENGIIRLQTEILSIYSEDIRLYKKYLYFKEEGVLREQLRIKGIFYDLTILSLLKGDFNAKHLSCE